METGLRACVRRLPGRPLQRASREESARSLVVAVRGAARERQNPRPEANNGRFGLGSHEFLHLRADRGPQDAPADDLEIDGVEDARTARTRGRSKPVRRLRPLLVLSMPLRRRYHIIEVKPTNVGMIRWAIVPACKTTYVPCDECSDRRTIGDSRNPVRPRVDRRTSQGHFRPGRASPAEYIATGRLPASGTSLPHRAEVSRRTLFIAAVCLQSHRPPRANPRWRDSVISVTSMPCRGSITRAAVSVRRSWLDCLPRWPSARLWKAGR
jgi:hypothetical protein